MTRTPRPQSTGRIVVPLPLSPPEAAHHETETIVSTAGGLAVIRVRSHVETFHLGGRGDVPTPVYSVAVRTPRTIRERRGFVEVFPHFLFAGEGGSGVTPSNHAEVHVAVGLQLEALAEARVERHRAERHRAAADRGPAHPARPVRPRMPSHPGGGASAGVPPAPVRPRVRLRRVGVPPVAPLAA